MILYCLSKPGSRRGDFTKLIKIVPHNEDEDNEVPHNKVTHNKAEDNVCNATVYYSYIVAGDIQTTATLEHTHNTYKIHIGKKTGIISPGYITFKKEKWIKLDMNNPAFCRWFIDDKINNIKGGGKNGAIFKERFIDILSDPNNLFIERCPKAGTMDGDYIYMHNGIKIHKCSYYGEFSNIFTSNKGCHEPSEERMFQEVLKFMPKGAIMVELGSYWAFYTMWFHKVVPNAKNYCIEPNLENLQYGVNNCNENKVKAKFTQMAISCNNFPPYLESKNINYIDLLHSDIQGHELDLIYSIKPMLREKRIRYLFISTHSNKIHYEIIDILKECNYRIVTSADFDDETFCYDGIIVACCNDNMEMSSVDLGSRRNTPLRNSMYFPK